MVRGKVILLGGLGAFLFSLLLGFVGGVPFFTLLLRATVGSAIFAALLWGAVWVIETFLPELLQPLEEPKKEGNIVDLVIPPHNPHAEDELDGEAQESSGFEDFIEEVEEVSNPVPMRETKRSIDDPSLDDNSGEDLPDLGGFGDSFRSDIPFDAPVGGSTASKKSVDMGGDPAVLAKAIQSLLKKDKEG